MWFWGEGMGWWMVFGGIMMVLFWGGIIVLVVWGIRKLTGGGSQETGQRPTPLDIAKERYAKGEMSREEFEQVKKDLS
jgi:putative membrane protein